MKADGLFQSAPLTKARGDSAWCAGSAVSVLVSIRSPHKSKGRPNAAILAYRWLPFQSAPLTKARGDSAATPRRTRTGCFNPLPSQKQGETSTRRRPRRASCVSIRSPHKSKGRLASHPPLGTHKTFQSAPLTKARGDRGRGRSDDNFDLFQSAPLTKARGDSLLKSMRVGTLSFNPLPSQKQGETRRMVDHRYRLRVSIRSPHKSKGRHIRIAPICPPMLFQSAPLTKARGDLG